MYEWSACGNYIIVQTIKLGASVCSYGSLSFLIFLGLFESIILKQIALNVAIDYS